MEEHKTDWDRKDLKAYIMLYFANADFMETQDEKEMIKSKVGVTEYKHIHKEFEKDNDYASIQKITNTAERLDLSNEKMESILKEIQVMFIDDDPSDRLEANLYRGLKHLFG